MLGDDPRESRDDAGRVRAPLKTHQFGFDPFERFRIAAKGVAASVRPAASRHLAAGVAAVALVAVLTASLISAAGGGSAKSAGAERERALVEREAQVKRRESDLAALDGKRADAESRIRDSEKRIADLETRREDLQRQVAELTAPIAPSEGENERPVRAAAAPDEDDPSPPDEAPDAAAPSPAASRSAAAADEPSSARVDQDEASADAAGDARTDEAETDAAAATDAPMRVVIHVDSADPKARERARAVAAELRRRGVSAPEIRGVPRPVRRDAVRFFHDEDRAAASTLQEAVRQAAPSAARGGAQSQDFRGFRAPPRPGTLELWLS